MGGKIGLVKEVLWRATSRQRKDFEKPRDKNSPKRRLVAGAAREGNAEEKRKPKKKKNWRGKRSTGEEKGLSMRIHSQSYLC